MNVLWFIVGCIGLAFLVLPSIWLAKERIGIEFVRSNNLMSHYLPKRHGKRGKWAGPGHPFKSTRYQYTSKTHVLAPTTIIALFREPFSFNGVR